MPDWIRMNMISKEGAFIMAKVFITLTGTKHYFGNDFLEKGTKIRLEKEPDNEYDKEAIKVTYVMMLLLLRFFSFFFGAIVLLPF